MSRNELSRRALGRLGLGVASAALWRGPAFANTYPTRIAVIDYGLAEALILIGLPPIAVMSAEDWKIWVVEPALPPGTADLGASVEPNFERLAALKPDLILTTDYVAMAEPTLQRIAPVERLTIHGSADGFEPVPRSVEVTRALGRITGRESEAEAAIASFDAELETLGARLRPRHTRALLFLSFLDPRHVRVYGRKGLYGNVLTRLGLENAWEGEVNSWGFATVGVEELVKAGEAECVVIEPVAADIWPALARSPLWTHLPFVSEGRVATMPASLMFGTLPSALRFARLLDKLPEGGSA
ncbi:ABC transporter substrate-binding protein [Aureimonas sp. AU40]|uniref:ABC transporter substrate-binding protein n=1 Tax=Aureimonas sp. AU40 TaxID=1637747 RepID=UPI0007819E27|nr:ABC transporter substrate-binding protein [Aureimonas sp. AU40]